MNGPPVTASEKAPFKVNLTLKVVGKRPDGYHLLETLFAFADGGDVLSWEPGGRLELVVRGDFAHVAPLDETNLVMKAASALASHYPEHARRGGTLVLEKVVPAGAGLGGGSADAAAALRLLNRVWQIDSGLDELSELARRLGADVPACLFSRPAWARGVGDKLDFLPAGRPLPMLVVHPGTAVQTASVFNSFSKVYSKACTSWPPTAPHLNDRTFWRNDLEASACSLEPSIAALLVQLREFRDENRDVLAIAMSGSGSACYMLCQNFATIQHLALCLRDLYRDAWIWQGRLISPFV
jgi:4-diphosphocytidyl-2-C-methyl-D-erythritol kinase